MKMSRNELLNITEDDLFDPFFGTIRSIFGLPEDRHARRTLEMRTDIEDLGDYYRLSIDMPGVDKKDINLTFNDGYLNIEASVNQNNDRKDEEGHYIRRERYSGSVSRSYYLGDIEEKDIKAKLDNGILTLTLPKEDRKVIEKKHTIAID